MLLTPLSDDKNLNHRKSILKAFAHAKNKCGRKTEICFEKGAKHCRNRRKPLTGSQQFALFPQRFQKASYTGLLKFIVVQG